MESNIFQEFPIFNNIDINIKKQIEYFHVFCKSAIFVTLQSIVYKVEQDPIQVDKIACDLEICEFFGSTDLLFGRKIQNDSSNSIIYVCFDYDTTQTTTFRQLSSLDNKRIICISIGYDQCLALSSQGLVYILEKSSIIEGNLDKNVEAINLNPNNPFKYQYIHCHEQFSFVVTTCGRVYVWNGFDFNNAKQLNLPNDSNFNPINIVKISSYSNGVLLLESNGNVYKVEESFESVAQRIDTQNKFIDIYENILQSEECVFEFTGQDLDEKSHIDFFDYYMRSPEGPVTKQTIKIQRDMYNSWYIMASNISQVQIERQNKKVKTDQSNQDVLKVEFNYIYCKNGNFISKFSGSNRKPGYIYDEQQCNVSVWRVQDQFNKYYAVKQINIKGKFYEVLREILVMSQTKGSDFVVKFITAWIEWKVDEAFAYIQMEYCLCNLRKFIETKKQHFEELQQSMKKTECNLTCNLLLQLSSCLKYLHTSEPPIIHRDLKPENILLSKDRKLKICDFGLSKLFKNPKNTAGIGTQDYIAPELWTENYNLSVDHFSFGQISKDMFNFKKNGQIDINCYSGTELEQLFNNLSELLSKMTSDEPDNRPNCRKIRESFKDFLKLTPINSNSNDNIISMISSIISKFENSFNI